MATKQPEVCFGSEIRRLRLTTGMSLRLLARRCGISPVYLSDIENNRKPAPSVDILHALIHLLQADGEALTRLALQSLDRYGGTARKPRLAEQLSTDEYLLVMKKKQTLAPDEFRAWLTTTTVPNTRNERNIKKRIRTIVTERLRREAPLSLGFDEEAGQTSPGHDLCQCAGRHDTPDPPATFIRQYEGQSEKEALDIFVDTCYREWKSMKTTFARNHYFSLLEDTTYALRTMTLRFSSLDTTAE